jgi:hypothetical protein
VARTLGGAVFLGWIVRAVSASLSGILGIVRSFALALMTGLMIGTLKGSSWVSVVKVAGLCGALGPLGINILRDGPAPTRQEWILTILAVPVVLSASYFLGQAGEQRKAVQSLTRRTLPELAAEV